jgi:hypothetical protein
MASSRQHPSPQMIVVSIYEQGVLLEDQIVPERYAQALENYWSNQGYEVRQSPA